MTRLFLFFALCLTLITAPLTTAPVLAATPNYSVAVPGVVVIPIQLSGQYTVTTSNAARFAIPFPARAVGASCSARASGGTSPTLTVDINDDGTTILSGDISVTAGSVSEGSINAASLADESVVTIDLTIGGTSPTWDDITCLLTVVRS